MSEDGVTVISGRKKTKTLRRSAAQSSVEGPYTHRQTHASVYGANRPDRLKYQIV